MSTQTTDLDAIFEGEVGGLRYVVLPDVDQHGEAWATLTFRVGTADERATDHGITHLVEHLMMHDTHDLYVGCNAEVSTTTTSFYAQGQPDQVEKFLRHVVARAAELPIQHLQAEREMIKVEESHGGSQLASPVSHFGVQGYGLTTMPQQVDSIGAHQLRQWAGRFLVAGNAVLAVRGLDPVTLGLHLPAGPFHPEPVADEVSRLAPAYYRQERAGFMLSSILPSGWSTSVLAVVLEQLLMKRLRHEESLVYGVHAQALQVNHTTSQMLISSDGVPDKGQQLIDAFLSQLNQMSAHLDEDVVRRAITQIKRSCTNRDPVAYLHERAEEILLGSTGFSLRQLQDLDAVSVQSVQEMLAQLMKRPVMMIGTEVQMPQNWIDVDTLSFSSRRIIGRQFVPGPRVGGDDRLVISEEGISHLSAGSLMTLEWDSLVLVRRLSDHSWTLTSQRGGTLCLEPLYWHEGEEIEREICQRAPAQTILDIQLPAQEEPAPSPGGLGRRIELGVMAAFLAAALGIAAYAFIVPGQMVMLAVAIFVAFIGAMLGLDARLRRVRAGHVQSMGSIRRESFLANSSDARLKIVTALLWVVPTVLIVVVFLLANRLFWPAALMYGFAIQAIREWSRRS